MDINALMQAISTLGFPIVCCVAMFVKSNKDQERHREESKEWMKTVENNTLVIQRFIDKVDEKEVK